MDERQGTAIGDTKEDNLEIDEVVEGGRLTWGGVIVADIKEELLGNHAIAEIVSKSMVGKPEDEKKK